MNWPKCSVIVLNWNGEGHLRANLPAVLDLDYPDFEVLVVDNGSTDGSVGFVEELALQRPGDNLRLLALRKNWGYCRGKNVGARFASGKYLWLLDCDVRPESNCLKGLVEFIEAEGDDERIAMPTVRGLEDGSRVMSSGLAFTFHGPQIAASRLRWPSGKKTIRVHAATGNVIFISKSYWRRLGGFDPKAPFHLDDMDLGARALVSGGSVWCLPGLTAYHPLEDSAQTAQRRRWEYRWLFQNTPTILLRNFEWKTIALMLPCCVAVQLLQVAKAALSHADIKMPFVWICAWKNLIASWPRVMRSRRAIQATRRKRDSEFIFTSNFWRL